jgi:hypothetical protein
MGADVVAFATREALRYTTTDALDWSTTHPAVTSLSPAAEHLSDGRPFDAYLLAPGTYKTINKFATGIADTAVTATLATALGQLERGAAEVLVAPTTHGAMHNSVRTQSLHRLRNVGVHLIAPRDANGKHNLPPEDALAAAVSRAVSSSELRGARVLVTGDSTPVPRSIPICTCWRSSIRRAWATRRSWLSPGRGWTAATRRWSSTAGKRSRPMASRSPTSWRNEAPSSGSTPSGGSRAGSCGISNGRSHRRHERVQSGNDLDPYIPQGGKVE